MDSTPQPQQRTSHHVVVVVAASSLPALAAAAAAAATHRGKVPSLGLATRARPPDTARYLLLTACCAKLNSAY